MVAHFAPSPSRVEIAYPDGNYLLSPSEEAEARRQAEARAAQETEARRQAEAEIERLKSELRKLRGEAG